MTSDELYFTQTALLAALPYDALRRIGGFLGVGLRRAARNRKEEWVAAIAAHWSDPVEVRRLETVFRLLGVVAPLDAEHFAFTDVGHQLLAQDRLLLSSSTWSSGEAVAAEWSPSENDQSLTLRFAWCASPSAQARVVLFSEDL